MSRHVICKAASQTFDLLRREPLSLILHRSCHCLVCVSVSIQIATGVGHGGSVRKERQGEGIDREEDETYVSLVFESSPLP